MYLHRLSPNYKRLFRGFRFAEGDLPLTLFCVQLDGVVADVDEAAHLDGDDDLLLSRRRILRRNQRYPESPNRLSCNNDFLDEKESSINVTSLPHPFSTLFKEMRY
jgi:hypothetical protein